MGFNTSYLVNKKIATQPTERIEEEVLEPTFAVAAGTRRTRTPSINLANYKSFSIHVFNDPANDTLNSDHAIEILYFPNVEGRTGDAIAPPLTIMGNTDKLQNRVLATEPREIVGLTNYIQIWNKDTVAHTYKIKIVKFRW